MSSITKDEDKPGKKNVKQLLEERKKQRRKKQLIIAGVVAVLVFLVWFAMQPLTAGINYGICRTYLETDLKYPNTFKITQYDEYGRSLRIFFTYVDEFGGTRSEMIECISSPNTAAGYPTFQDIKINRKSIDTEALARFNLAIPGILIGGPNLVIPAPAKDDLQSLKRD